MFTTSDSKMPNAFSVKKLVDANSMSEETGKHLKPVGTRPGIMYGSCKVHKNVSLALHLSDQFFLLYKHQHTTLQSI